MDRYGRVRLAELVTAFYGEVLRSPRLAHFFRSVPMGGLIEHQATFMATVMGGPPSYSAPEIEAAHHRLGISDDDFEEMLRLLEQAFREFEIDAADTGAVISEYRRLQPRVVKPPEDGDP